MNCVYCFFTCFFLIATLFWWKPSLMTYAAYIHHEGLNVHNEIDQQTNLTWTLHLFHARFCSQNLSTNYCLNFRFLTIADCHPCKNSMLCIPLNQRTCGADRNTCRHFFSCQFHKEIPVTRIESFIPTTCILSH